MKPGLYPLAAGFGAARRPQRPAPPFLNKAVRCSRRSNHTGARVADDVRNVMRQVPQPVSVVVAKLADGTYHGATLSSFSSVALHPEPLISFSLRLPSRLADALNTSRNARKGTSSDNKSMPTLAMDKSAITRSSEPYFSINILSGNQACQNLAHRFSQAQASHEAALSDREQWRYLSDTGKGIKWDEPAQTDGIPIAKNGMASLVCQVVTSFHLSKLLETSTGQANKEASRVLEVGRAKQEEGSMLFIAKVVEVLPGSSTEVLLYKDRQYTSL